MQQYSVCATVCHTPLAAPRRARRTRALGPPAPTRGRPQATHPPPRARALTQALCLDSLGLDGGDFFFVFFVFVSPPSEAVRRCEGTLPLRFEL